MPKQLEMLQQSLSIKPSAELDEPRLWVRRLVIWKAHDEPPIRDIELRPGMNIVWTSDENGIGHGGGKTLFCRLLRYCLGEETFAPSDQRAAISQKLSEGWVGAEIIINKQPWGVLRPIGTRRTHFAIPNISPEDLVCGKHEATGIEPLIDAIEDVVLTKKVKEIIPNRRQDNRAWPVALAWFARDQECRFDHVLDWRSPVSESDSPASGLNKQDRLQVLRALLGAISAEEQEHRRKLSLYREESSQANTQKSHLEWEIERLKNRLRNELYTPQENAELLLDDIGIFQKSLNQRFSSKDNNLPNRLHEELISAREEHKNATEEVAQQEKRKEVLENKKPLLEELISALEGEYPGLSISIKKAEEYPCPICEVPISRVLAEGCNLSNELPNLDVCKSRLERNRKEVEEKTKLLEETKIELLQLNKNLVRSKEILDEKRKKLIKAEKNHHDIEEERASQTIIENDIANLSKLACELDSIQEKIEITSTQERQQQHHINDHLKSHDKKISNLNEKLNPIIQYFLGGEAKAEARLASNEISIKIGLGGDRSTSAIDSLKVIAFDFSALCLSIEGVAASPSFFIHDSPREADLGLLLYQKIFHLMHELETLGDTPLFQYIITTTTPPPKEFSGAPWTILKISGSPASNRLLKVDL